VKVDYELAANTHTYAGAHAALSILFPDTKAISILDVGCAPGAWLRAGINLVGIDELDLEADQAIYDTAAAFGSMQRSLTRAWMALTKPRIHRKSLSEDASAARFTVS
jgi:hypothetical protein